MPCVHIPKKYMKRGRKGWVRVEHILPSLKVTVHFFNGRVPKRYNTGWWKVVES